MQKFRVLLAIDDASLGGGQMHVLLLAKYLRSDNFNVEIATEATGWLVEEARKLDIIVHQIAIANRLTWQSFEQIKNLLSFKQFDVLHTHGGTAGFWARGVVLCLKKRPVVVHTYHGLHYLNISQQGIKAIPQLLKRLIFKTIDLLLLPYTDRIICVCYSDYSKAIAVGVANSEKTSIVYNGIDINRFSVPLNQKKIRQLFQIEPTEFIFGTVGRLHEQKGYRFLLQAVAKLDYPARVLIVGDGELRDELAALATNLQISDRIVFFGTRNDIHEFLSAIDVFVLPSLWEGQPIALIEALAIGKPCIVTDVDGIPEIIEHKVNGYLVPSGDVEALTNAMNLAIEHPELIHHNVDFSSSWIGQKFSAQNMATEISKIYLNSIIDSQN